MKINSKKKFFVLLACMILVISSMNLMLQQMYPITMYLRKLLQSTESVHFMRL